MLIQPTIEKLCAMRLRGMAEAFQQQQDADIHSLSFEERFGDQMAEQVRFGGLRNLFHVIDFAVAQSFEPELAVVFEGDPIHRLSSSPVADRSRRRGRQTQRLFQPIHRRQNLSMKFRQGHPALAEMAIVFGQAADAGLVSHSQRADASPSSLTPGKHYRRMESPVWLGAMAGRVATARFETV